MPKCKSCGAEILWVTTAAGKSTPVDEKTTRVAMLIEEGEGNFKIGEVAKGHVSHWVTCPTANEHRRG